MTHFFLTLRTLTQLESATGGIAIRKPQRLSACIASLLVCGIIAPQQASAVDDAGLVKQLNNPISALISVPIKFDWDRGIGEKDVDRPTYIVPPVTPFSLNERWNVISRTVMPVYIDVESPVTGNDNTYGLGDITQSFFFSPKVPTTSGWIWGAGPALSLPAGRDDLTLDQFSIGPTAVVLKQGDTWTYGGLFNHLWSVSRDDDNPNISNTFLRPFLSYTTKSKTTFDLNTESSYDWKSEEWTVPVNFTVSQLVKVGKQPISLQLGYRNYHDAPDGGPDWGVRFSVTLLFQE